MAVPKRLGSGWHKENLRHRQAKLYGKAYPSSYKSLTFNQLKKKDVFLKYQSDTDKDGVTNIKDCRPLDKNKQGTNEQVVDNWLSYSQRDSADSLKSTGNTIYSYHTPIAIKLSDGKILVNKQKYSQTTSTHQGRIKRAIKNAGKDYEEVDEKIIIDKIYEEESKPKEKPVFEKILPGKTIDISEVKERNEKAGMSWFSKSNVRFFNSKWGKNAYVDKKGENAYFVSSEQIKDFLSGQFYPRKYSVRKANLKTGYIDTIGKFQAYSDNTSATQEAKRQANL